MRAIRVSVSAALLVVSTVVFAPAAFAASPLKVAVVQSASTAAAASVSGSNPSMYPIRVGRVVDMLRREPGGAFDVTVIGDAELSDIATLRGYDVVVFARTVATTEAERIAVRRYVLEGGGIVSIFSTSRYDYRPGYPSPYAGNSYKSYFWPFNFYWGFSGSSFMSQSFEYGELSELIMTKFCNDPLFEPNYVIAGNSPASHQILQMTAADLGSSAISITDPNHQYNETVWPIKGAPVTTLLNYRNEKLWDGRTTIEADRGKYGAATHMAGWAAPYYYGRVVAYGFQLYDLLGQRPAARLLVNSVKWASGSGTYGRIDRTPDVSVNAWFTRGQLWSTAGVSNRGNIQLRGRLRVDFYRPGASTPFDGCWIKDPSGWIPVSPGERYADTAQRKPSVKPSAGRWRVRVSYTYYDFFRRGWVAVYRDGNLDGTGSGMIWRGAGPLVTPAVALDAPKGSSEIAGGDRYGTSVAISRAFSVVRPAGRAVVLASGKSRTDALAAAPLAGKLGAPILLTAPDGLPATVKGELETLYGSAPASETVSLYVVSQLPVSVVTAARDAIAGAGGGSRTIDLHVLAGASPYETARNIAAAVGPSPTPGFQDTAFVVTGTGYADALSIAPVAAKLQVPILFADTTVPFATHSALDALGTKKCIIIGSTVVVSGATEAWLESNGHRGAGDPRLFGNTRYETCLKVVEFATSSAGFSDSSLFVATGANYPDALAIAPLAALAGHPVLLVHGAEIGLSPATAVYLLGRRGSPLPLTFVGSTSAVSAYVRGQIGVALAP